VYHSEFDSESTAATETMDPESSSG